MDQTDTSHDPQRWRGATELVPDREVQALAAAGLVGYRQDRGRLLHCLAHKPAPASRHADFHEVSADDLPDGGICVHPTCRADLLASPPTYGAPTQQEAAMFDQLASKARALEARRRAEQKATVLRDASTVLRRELHPRALTFADGERVADGVVHAANRLDELAVELLATPDTEELDAQLSTEQQIRGVQAWMALDLHTALGRAVDDKAKHQGHSTWADWWADLCATVRQRTHMDNARAVPAATEEDVREFVADLEKSAPESEAGR
jgi:hypothetical protein